MTTNTKIEWADHTFNPWWGCTKISPACDHCYAASLDKRTGGDHWGANQPRKRTSAKNWMDPIKWNKQADKFFAEHGRRQRVFCASMADVFDNEVDPQWRMDLFELIACTPNLDWMILTKRIGNAFSMVPLGWLCSSLQGAHGSVLHKYGWPQNVWLGATICNQEEADRDIPKLLAVPATKRFLSIEPMLGLVNIVHFLEDDKFQCPECLHSYNCVDETEIPRLECPLCGHDPVTEVNGQIDWIICGGESGPGARPMHPDWARSLRDQCAAAKVPFLFKQWGEWVPGTLIGNDYVSQVPELSPVALRCGKYNMLAFGESAETIIWKVGKKAAGRLLDGVAHNGVPT